MSETPIIDSSQAPGLGRVIPPDWKHIEKYPLRAILRAEAVPKRVRRFLSVPRALIAYYNQGREGACVGFSASLERSRANRTRKGIGYHYKYPLYDSRWLWNRAKDTDSFPFTNSGDNEGTEIRAALDILQNEGHLLKGESIPRTSEGIITYRWIHNVEEARAAIAAKKVVVCGIDWMDSFYTPRKRPDNHYIMGDVWPDPNGPVGGHAICLTGWDDDLQEIEFTNSWGLDYGLWGVVRMPIRVFHDLLINRMGEGAVITDR